MNSTVPNTLQTVLVIGYGNDLRSDDAVGQRIADAVGRQAWVPLPGGIPNVRSALTLLTSLPHRYRYRSSASLSHTPQENPKDSVYEVKSLAVHQLTPELAATLESAECVIFVDARLASEEGDGVQVCMIEPVDSGNFSLGHTSDPRSLLAFTLALYGHSPQAWLVTVPGMNFELGECLSPLARRGMAEALEKIDDLIRSQSWSVNPQ